MKSNGKTKKELCDELDSLKTKIRSLEDSLKNQLLMKRDIIESEISYRLLAESSPDAIFQLDSNGFVTFVSHAFENITGYSKEESLQKHFSVFFDQSGITIAKQSFSKILTEKSTTTLELYVRKKDSSIMIAEVSASPIIKENEVVGIQGIGRDITLRKKEQDELLHKVNKLEHTYEEYSEKYEKQRRDFENVKKRFQHFFDLNAVGMAIIDKHANWLEVNDKLCELLGRSKNELLQISVYEFTHPDDRSEEKRNYNNLKMNKATVFSMNKRFLRKNDALIYVSITVSSIKDESGNTEFFVLMAQDTTEITLASEHNRFQASIIEQIDNAVIVTDNDAEIIYWNAFAEKLFDYKIEEVIGNNIYETIILEDQENIGANIQSNLINENKWHGELELSKKNKSTFYAEITSNVIKNGKGNIRGFVSVIKDISEKKKIALELKEKEMRFRSLFNHSPISLWEEDFSEIKAFLDNLANQGISNFLDYFENNPNELKKCISRIKIIDVNDSTLQLYEVSSKKELFDNIAKIFNETSFKIFNEELQTLYAGNSTFESFTKQKTLKGKELFLQIKITIPPDYENSWKRVIVSIVDITIQNQIQEELKGSKAQFDQLANNMNEVFWIVDVNDNVLYINPAFEKIWGIKPEEAYKKNLWIDTLYPDDYPKLEGIRDLHKKGIQTEREYRIIRPDKTIRWIKDHAYPVKNNKYEVYRIVGIAEDITKRKHIELALQESEEKFRQISEQSLMGICILQEGEVKYANKALSNITGYTLEEMQEWTPETFPKLVHADDRDFVLEQYRKKQTGETEGIVHNYNYRFITKSKTTIWLEQYSKTIMYNNEPANFVTVLDITEKIHSQNELKRLSVALEQTSVGVVITDIHGTINYVNEKFQQTNGYSFDELIGKNPIILNSGETPPQVFENMWKTILAGNEWHGEVKNRKKSGETYWARASISPIKNESGEIVEFVSAQEDITESKAIEQSLLNAKRRAEESDKLKTSLLANMNHEFRTPMNGILGFTKIIEKQIKEPAPLGMIKKIQVSARRLMDTLNAILELSQLQSTGLDLNFSEIEICPLMHIVLEKYEYLAQQKDIEIHYQCDIEKPAILGDEQMVRDTFTHLIDNAIKYTEKGSVSVTISTITERDEEKISIEIKDTGIGIPNDKMNLIFHEFRQVSEGWSRKYEGNGLGLTLAKKMIDIMKGSISVESTLEVGTTFKILFPALGYIEKINENAEQIDLRSVNIVVVSDYFTENDFIQNLKTLELRYQTVDYENINNIISDNNTFDIIFLQINSNIDELKIESYLNVLQHSVDVALTPLVAILDSNAKITASTLKSLGFHSIVSEYRNPNLIRKTLSNIISDSKSHTNSKEKIQFPPADFLEEMRMLARKGDYRAILNMIPKLEKQKEYEKFIIEVKKHLYTYNLDNLLRFIK